MMHILWIVPKVLGAIVGLAVIVRMLQEIYVVCTAEVSSDDRELFKMVAERRAAESKVEEQRFCFQVTAVYSFHAGIVLRGWLLEGAITLYTPLSVPLKNGDLIPASVHGLGIVEGKCSTDAGRCVVVGQEPVEIDVIVRTIRPDQSDQVLTATLEGTSKKLE